MAARAIAEGVARTGAAISTTAATITDAVAQAPLAVTQKALEIVADRSTPVSAAAKRGAHELKKRNDLQKVASLMILTAVFAFLPGELLFAAVFPPENPAAHDARPSLVVFACLVVAAVIAWRNAKLARKGQAMDLAVPKQLVPWLILGVTVFLGWLVGRTIFR